MNKDDLPQHLVTPPHIKVLLNFGVKKRHVLYPKIDLELLVKTTLALRSPIDPRLDPSSAREEYKKLAHEAVLIIEGCQQILSAREAMQAISDEEAAREEREQRPRKVKFAEGVFKIVGDSNSGPTRGAKKLKNFLQALYGEFLLREDNSLPCEEWADSYLEFWRNSHFSEEEVKILRDKRNDYIKRGILEGDPVTDKIIEESACLASSDRASQKSDKNGKRPDQRRREGIDQRRPKDR